MALPLIRSALVIGSVGGAGQTLVATALVRALCQQGVRAVGMQAVARGVAASGGVVPGDELRHLAAAGALDLPPRALVPVLLPPGRGEGVERGEFSVRGEAGERGERAGRPPERAPTLDDVTERFRILATWADAVVVDAGDGTREGIQLGFGPPALAQALKLPVVLVVGLQAGCVEAAALRLQQLQRSGVECAAWVGNDLHAEPHAVEWLARLRPQLPGRELGMLPRLETDTIARAAAALDLPRVLHALAT